MKDIKDMEFQELVDMQTGDSIMALGRGNSLRAIIHEAMRMTLQWKAERTPEPKPKG